MTWRKIVGPIGVVVLLVGAWRAWGWPGVALVGGGLLMWLLLHFTRMMKVLERARDRPVGYCGSAVMLNAKLRPGVNLLHVIAMTRALGEQLGEKDAQPEIWRWTDGARLLRIPRRQAGPLGAGAARGRAAGGGSARAVKWLIPRLHPQGHFHEPASSLDGRP